MATAKVGSIREVLEKKAAAVNGPADYKQFDLLDTPEFRDAVQRKVAADLKKKEAEAELELVKGEIESYLAAVDQTKVQFDHLLVERRQGSTASSISSTKLIERGVSIDDIEAATVPGRSYTYVQITDPASAAAKRAEAAAKKAGRG